MCDLNEEIVCDLSEAKAATQAERWLRLGQQAGLGRAETADGLVIRFRDEAAAERELRDLVSVEGKCCAWARWEISRAGGELVLRVSSAPEGAAVLRTMFRGLPGARLARSGLHARPHRPHGLVLGQPRVAGGVDERGNHRNRRQ